MKIAYIVTVQIWLNDGLSKKIINQISCWNRLGIETKAYILLPVNIAENDLPSLQFPYVTIKAEPSKLSFINNSYKLSKFLNFPELESELRSYNPSHIYLRFELLKPFMNQIRRLKDKAEVVMEVNMLDLEERQSLKFSHLTGLLIGFYNRVTRNTVFRMADKLISVTHEIANHSSIAKFQLPSHVSYNSIDIFKNPTRKKGSQHAIPRLVMMVSEEFPWHGIDKLKELAIKTVNILEFTLIGNFKTRISSPNVKYTGFLNGNELKRAIEQSDIAVSSLAIHRCGLVEACPLKTRDYLSWQMPTIIGYLESIFVDTDVPDWVLCLDNHESNVKKSYERIIDFCYQNKDVVAPIEQVENMVHSDSIELKRLEFIRSKPVMKSALKPQMQSLEPL